MIKLIFCLFLSNICIAQKFVSTKQVVMEFNKSTQEFEVLDVTFDTEVISTDFNTLLKWESKEDFTLFELTQKAIIPSKKGIDMQVMYTTPTKCYIRVTIYKEGIDTIEFQFTKNNEKFKYILFGQWRN
jgi:hypothetical protein